ncbi:MAG: hypothetical protein WCJ30_16590 [Deltaproteobacteria bacterium]
MLPSFMPVKKVSVALEAKVAKAAAASAGSQGLSLSAWLNLAARNALAIEGGLAAVAEWESAQGPLTNAELAAADRVLDGASGGRVSRRRAS